MCVHIGKSYVAILSKSNKVHYLKEYIIVITSVSFGLSYYPGMCINFKPLHKTVICYSLTYDSERKLCFI